MLERGHSHKFRKIGVFLLFCFHYGIFMRKSLILKVRDFFKNTHFLNLIFSKIPILYQKLRAYLIFIKNYTYTQLSVTYISVFFFRFLPCAISFLLCLLHFFLHLIQMVLMVNLLILRAMVYFGFHKSSCNLQACPLFAILRIFSLFLHLLLLLLQLRFNH